MILPAAALALMVMPMAMALLLSAAAAAASIGQPGCNTNCGNVSVPYPFGFGPSRCYWPGLNLNCDTRHHNPRLLLGDGSLQVAEILLSNGTVRVMRTGAILNTTGDPSSPSWNASVSLDFGRGLREHGYLLSSRNELVVSGCNVMATLYGNIAGEEITRDLLSGCATVCTKSDSNGVAGTSGSCQAPLFNSSVPSQVQARSLDGVNDTVEPVIVFVAEQGWFDKQQGLVGLGEVPLLLNFGIKQHLPQPQRKRTAGCPQQVRRMLCKSEQSSCNALVQGYTCSCDPGYDGNPYLVGGCQVSGRCPEDVINRLCKSENSDCWQGNGVFTCHCSKGYDGNPNISHGCHDIDECKDPVLRESCLDLGGSCFNFPGGYECQCPPGMHGNLYQPGGCVVVNKSPTRLIIGFLVASGPALLILVLGILFLLRKLKQRRIELLKQKYFKQNRGQLLQQLLSQNADIAERMIIPLDELAKATNNFDKAREIGGGGHGIVYKGILSDQHVVAIKKSKITKQKEIDEFINEVAILSQINHKNVVKLFGCCLETEVPLLVYEFVSNGTLDKHLHIEEPNRSLSWSDRLRIATEIATSLAYLHSSVSIPIIHRDIKSSNILLDDTMTSKISDFGASRYIPIDNTGLTTRIQGTIGYLDPECFRTGRLTEQSDVYSFGVILVELLSRKKPNCPHLSNEHGGLLQHFLNLLASRNLGEIVDPQVLEEGGTEVQEVAMLAASCINLRGEERPTMRQVEITLEGLQQGSNKTYKKDDMVTEELQNASIGEKYSSGTSQRQRFEESTRRYSLEQEMMISASYPR